MSGCFTPDELLKVNIRIWGWYIEQYKMVKDNGEESLERDVEEDKKINHEG